jgi:hypothetical protein
MSLATRINNLYTKYKKPLAILVLLFFMYKIFNYYNSRYEGYSSQNQCTSYQNCTDCIGSTNNCFWGDRDQKCSSTNKSGYSRICSGSNPNPNPNPSCPKCHECPKLTLLKTPTFITQQ